MSISILWCLTMGFGPLCQMHNMHSTTAYLRAAKLKMCSELNEEAVGKNNCNLWSTPNSDKIFWVKYETDLN